MVGQMSPEERRRCTFDQLDELLGEEAALEDALATAAKSNGFKPEHSILSNDPSVLRY